MGGIHHHRSRSQALFMSSRKIVYNGKWGARSVAVLIMAQVLHRRSPCSGNACAGSPDEQGLRRVTMRFETTPFLLVCSTHR